MRHLADAWLRTCRRVDARGDVAATGADLLARYAGPDRGYHDLTHLDEVLRHVDELADEATRPDDVRLAAWFHDAVYEPGSDGNEAASGELARSALRALRVDDRTVEAVGRLVELTNGHDPDRDDADGAVLCDADLAILAADPERYAAYVAGVRREYAAYSDGDFARGRAAVLRDLLGHATLYRTATGRRDWEAPARANLTRELASLEEQARAGDHSREPGRADMTDLTHIERFAVVQRITMMVNRYEIRAVSPDGTPTELLAMAQQKRMTFKEEVTFFTDEQRSVPVFSFKARQRMDLGATYDVLDANRVPIGLFRKDFGKSLLRSTWHLESGDIAAVGTERSQNVAIARRVWELLPVDLPSPFVFHFDFTDQAGRVVLSSVRQRSLRDRYDVTVPGAVLDGRVAAAMAVALDALQSR